MHGLIDHFQAWQDIAFFGGSVFKRANLLNHNLMLQHFFTLMIVFIGYLSVILATNKILFQYFLFRALFIEGFVPMGKILKYFHIQP